MVYRSEGLTCETAVGDPPIGVTPRSINRHTDRLARHEEDATTVPGAGAALRRGCGHRFRADDLAQFLDGTTGGVDLALERGEPVG